VIHPAQTGRPADKSARDFERISRAIAFMQRAATAQPRLAEVAHHINLSEHHFQRLFTRWAGVSPKRFLQFLTLEHARAQLSAARSVLDLAADVGLSSSGRLHDLFVTLEALTPGEAQSGGAGLTLAYGIHPSPFGPCLIATTARGICSMHFPDSHTDARLLLQQDWPAATLKAGPDATANIARRIFDPLASATGAPLSLLVKGTNFQLQVWRALLRIPPGALTTYSRIARQLGQPTAARAVGNAVGANPIAWLIPCHRVIRQSGILGPYRWGAERKVALLGWEAAHLASQNEGMTI